VGKCKRKTNRRTLWPSWRAISTKIIPSDRKHTPVSRHEFSESNLSRDGFRSKHDTRLTTLNLIKRSHYFIPDDFDRGVLNGDWLDLCGVRDETLGMLLEGDVLGNQGRYIGVNSDPEVISVNRGILGVCLKLCGFKMSGQIW